MLFHDQPLEEQLNSLIDDLDERTIDLLIRLLGDESAVIDHEHDSLICRKDGMKIRAILVESSDLIPS
ncbi:MAG: hypothetical protein R3B48_21070 [Kofleriaceae bacterium]